jgi:hypothetical protein
MSALEIIKDYPRNKAEITKFNKSAKDQLLELAGSPDITKAYAMVKIVNTITQTILEDDKIKANVIKEVEKYPKLDRSFQGFDWQIKSSGGSWDYSECGDTVLMDLEADMKKLKKKIDARKQVLQNISNDDEMVDGKTGEVLKKAVYTPGGETLAMAMK